MNIQQLFDPSSAQTPFESYAQYSSYLFACVDLLLRQYVNQLMNSFTSENGNLKNVLYPDLEIANTLCEKHVSDFLNEQSPAESALDFDPSETLDEADSFTSEFDDLFADFANDVGSFEPETEPDIHSMLSVLRQRAAITEVPLPLH